MNFKKGIYMHLLPAAAIAATCILTACSTDECMGNKNSLPYAGFYSSQTGQKVKIDSIAIYGIGAPGDSMLMRCGTNVSAVYLPFDIDSDRTGYVIEYLQLKLRDIKPYADTVTFNYEIKPYFVSSACGVSYRYQIESIKTTHLYIDSVTCPQRVIDNADVENLQIYFKTRQ